MANIENPTSPTPTTLEPEELRPIYTNKNSVVWNYESTILGVKYQLDRALEKKESIRIESDTFGLEGLQFYLCLAFPLADATGEDNIPSDRFDVDCCVLKTPKEKVLGDAWFRKADFAIVIKHPQQNKRNWNLGDFDSDYLSLDSHESSFGRPRVGKIKKLQEMLLPDGSLNIAVTLKAELPPTFVNVSHTMASNSPFRKLLPQGHLSDTTLRIKNTSNTSDKSDDLPAHKVVLSCRSGKFKSMFSVGWKESSTSSPIVEITIDTMRSLLEFMYTGFLHHHQPSNREARLQLIRAADYFQAKHFHLYIANEILTHDLKASTALGILEFASKYKAYGRLVEMVQDWARGRWDQLVATEAFTESMRGVDGSVIADIFQKESRSCERVSVGSLPGSLADEPSGSVDGMHADVVTGES
ncbi:hypothetical protein HDV00_007396 [Rhizophlyctis rosea]|nr:hypothetical protein HDV00_007396 [Rhizophlyctis rosea]